MEVTITRADVLAEAARRYRRYYGRRLLALYVLPQASFEPEEDDESLYLVLLLREPYEHFEETGPVSSIADALIGEYGVGIFPHIASARGDDLAREAREEGVRL